ncbi:MAG: methyl-accepting chemotaxis protein [Treponema sp.]|nr:methyl-accepting chemotaxis protein [Treponema sp.]MDY2925158.1 methyl-accepting chemotaxis protein [Treponema sp.]
MSVPYKFRLLVISLFFFCLSSAVITYIGVKTLSGSAIMAFSERGIAAVYKANSAVDAEQFIQLADFGTESHPYYKILYDKLSSIRQAQGCSYLYAMVNLDKTKYKYVVDSSSPFDENFNSCGTIEDLGRNSRFAAACLENQKVTVSSIYKSAEKGWVITVFSPILSNGKSAGFVACDYRVQELVENIHKSRNKMILCAFAATLTGFLTLLFYISLFFKRLKKVSDAMEDISSGARDLTQRLKIHGNTELDILCKAYNDIIVNLQEMVKNISKSIDSLSDNSSVLLKQNNETISLIENAKFSIEDIYSKADNQNMLSARVSDGIDGVEKAVTILDEKIVQQSEAVEKSFEAVEDIHSSINSANQAIERISNEYAVIVAETEDGRQKQNQVLNQVDVIVQQAQNLAQANAVISSIASQTNLLAMNAAIEAAHAGESGKGFSVVADEIRKLAENSATQSTAVTKLIDDIEKAIEGIVTVSKSSSDSFSSLGGKIQGMNALLAEIKDDMKNQNSGAKHILDMMQLLSNATAGIKESSDTMKNNTLSVVEQIVHLKESSKAILISGNAASRHLEKMTENAEITMTQAKQNDELTGSVHEIVAGYKVS